MCAVLSVTQAWATRYPAIPQDVCPAGDGSINPTVSLLQPPRPIDELPVTLCRILFAVHVHSPLGRFIASKGKWGEPFRGRNKPHEHILGASQTRPGSVWTVRKSSTGTPGERSRRRGRENIQGRPRSTGWRDLPRTGRWSGNIPYRCFRIGDLRRFPDAGRRQAGGGG